MQIEKLTLHLQKKEQTGKTLPARRIQTPQVEKSAPDLPGESSPLVKPRMAPGGQRDERCAARAAPPPFPLYTPPSHPLSSQNALQDKLAPVRSSAYLTKAVFSHPGGAISKS